MLAFLVYIAAACMALWFALLLTIMLGGIIGVPLPATAASGIKVGVAARGYRNAGTYGSPTWTSMGLLRNVTPNCPWEMAEVGARETRAKLYAKTRVDLNIQFDMRADDADAGFSAVANSALSPTSVLDLMFLDAPVTTEGARGFRAEWSLSLSGQPQELDGAIFNNFDAKPGWSSNGYPSTVVMGASSTPTFTAF